MGVSGGPYIVRDSSLVLELDAADRNSYVSGSTTWFDVSGNNNSGSLINGPTYNSANNGSLVFTGVNENINCGNSSNLQITSGSISAWVKAINAGSGFRGIIVKQTNYGLFFNDNILTVYDWGSGATRSTGINIADGTWKNTVMTFTENTGTPSNNAIIYLNGNSVLTTTIKLNSNIVPLTLAAGSPSTQFLNGNIASVQVYNRVLTPAEILQNYNALKSRFNL